MTGDRAQAILFRYFLNLVAQDNPSRVIQAFSRLFIDHISPDDPEDDAVDDPEDAAQSRQVVSNRAATESPSPLQALYQLALLNEAAVFHQTLKRACYIVVNNWNHQRHEGLICELLRQFQLPTLQRSGDSRLQQRLRQWVRDFVASPDYQALLLFAGNCDLTPHWEPRTTDLPALPALPPPQPTWSERYAAHVLAAQALNPDNSPEQRQAAAHRAQQLRDRFKFDLAWYMAKLQSPAADRHQLKNPTSLGDRVLQIVKTIVLRNGKQGYVSLAHLFLEQTRGLTYSGYKRSLFKYLVASTRQSDLNEKIRQKLQKRLENIEVHCQRDRLSNRLHQETCEQMIKFLMSETGHTPSSLFIVLLSQGNPLSLTILLLKLVLICPPARSQLDRCAAQLLQYYQAFESKDCRWVAYFFDILNVTFAIYTENIHYNIVELPPSKNSSANGKARFDRYRIFSQEIDRWDKAFSEEF